MDIQDRKKSLTAEELRQRYNLEDISKNKKAIQMQKNDLTKLDATLEQFVEITTRDIEELQDQVDGNITTWFYSGVPTLLNEPAVEWTTDTEKDKHLGDLYYDQDSGYAYRFQLSNNVYSWLKLTDSDVTEALAIANAAQDTADSKRRVFVVQPTPPYDIGDIWLRDGELYRCQTATVEGGTYNPSHWILGVDYTDDTVALQAKQELDQFKIDVQENYATNAELVTTASSITGRVEETYTYITTVENTLGNQINDITTTTQVSTGKNHLYTDDAVEGNALSYSVDGATSQNGTPTPDSPVEVKTIPSIMNLFDKDNTEWYRNNNSAFINTNDNNTTRIRTNSFTIEGGKTYTLSGIPSEMTLIQIRTYSEYGGTNTSDVTLSGNTFTLGSNVKYIHIVFGGTDFTDDTKILMKSANIMLEEGSVSHEYVPYGVYIRIKIQNEDYTQEKEVLIDMSKENLFDSANANVLNLYPTSTQISSSSLTRMLYIPCQSNTTYTINKILSARFRVATTQNIPDTGVATNNYIANDTGTFITITTSSTSNYLCVFFYQTQYDTTYTYEEVLDSIKIYESNNPTPYYELCKIGDYKDTLSIDSSGNCVINKNVGKVVLNGGESGWAKPSSGYTITIPKTILSNSTLTAGTTNLYCNYFTISSTTVNVNGKNGQIYVGNNDLNFNYDNGVTTLANFKTWLSTHNTDVYYVLATPETITLSNTQIPLYEGINHIYLVDDLETNTSISFYRQTPLTGTYATVTQLNEVDTQKTQQITQVRNEMLVDLNSERLRIDAIRETIDETGVPIVNTGTGYVFDSEGLKIEKTDQDVKSQLDNDGLSVKYNDADVLTARSDGVNAVNMTVNKFYVQKPIRMEKTKSISDSTSIGLGFFYVGE